MEKFSLTIGVHFDSEVIFAGRSFNVIYLIINIVPNRNVFSIIKELCVLFY